MRLYGFLSVSSSSIWRICSAVSTMSGARFLGVLDNICQVHSKHSKGLAGTIVQFTRALCDAVLDPA